MILPIGKYAEKLDRLQSAYLDRKRRRAGGRFQRYQADPVGYCRDVLGVTLTADQAAIACALPGRVKVGAGHSVGKTFLSAAVVNWWFDTRDPGVVLTTAPTYRDVVDLLWTEVRLQRRRAKVNLAMPFIGPAAPEMRTSEEHWAKGYTARKGESFQGRHRDRMLFVFDEDEGIDPVYWRTTDTMYQPDGGHGWVAIGNPTTTSSQSYVEEQAAGPGGDPKWKHFSLSCLNHPNVLAGLRGEAPPIPNAVSLGQVEQWVRDWTQPIGVGERQATDVEWPPASGQFRRPGPIFESRVLGRRPTTAGDTVWGDSLWAACEGPGELPEVATLPEVGCDVARFGDDWTEIHVRCGGVSLHHEAANGWDTARTAGRLKQLCREWAGWVTARRAAQAAPFDPQQILVKVDDDGVGGGVVDHGSGWNWVGVSAAAVPYDREDYPNRRSELWFALADRARRGELRLGLLDPAVRRELKRQALAPSWKLDSAGRRVVEPKADTKKKLGRSPDGMDAMNLAYAPAGGQEVATFVDRGGRADWRTRSRRR